MLKQKILKSKTMNCSHNKAYQNLSNESSKQVIFYLSIETKLKLGSPSTDKGKVI